MHHKRAEGSGGSVLEPFGCCACRQDTGKSIPAEESPQNVPPGNQDWQSLMRFRKFRFCLTELSAGCSHTQCRNHKLLEQLDDGVIVMPYEYFLERL